jgi:hypothetical protein
LFLQRGNCPLLLRSHHCAANSPSVRVVPQNRFHCQSPSIRRFSELNLINFLCFSGTIFHQF